MIRWILYAAALAFAGLFIVLPVAVAVGGGLSPAWLAEALRHPLHQEALLNSLGIGAVATLIAAVLATPLAWIAARHRFPGQSLAEGLVLAPLILPPFVGALGFTQVVGQYGALNAFLGWLGWVEPGAGPDWLGDYRFLAVCLLEGLGLFPILYLSLSNALSRMDPGLVEAARVAGAGVWTAWWRVSFPLLRPAFLAGGTVVFVAAFTDLGTPLLLGYERCLPVLILNGLMELETSRMPLALAVIMLVVAGGLYVTARWLFARRIDAASRGVARSETRPLVGWRAVAAWAPFAGVAALAVFPHGAVALLAVSGDWYGTVLPASMTLRHLEDALGHPLVVPGILNSLGYAAGATLLALALGGFIAWTGARWRPRGWQILDGLAMVPLAVPGIIMAAGYLAMTQAFPWLKSWLDPFTDPTLILVIAYAVRRLPLVVRAASAGLEQSPPALEEAAAACGAPPWRRIVAITVPLIAGSLAAGAVLTFSFAMLEVSDSLILAQGRDYWPVTRVLFELVGLLGPGPFLACALGLWAMAFLAAALACAAALARRRVGDLFRE
jgi:iron(III) transport system permease protein